MKWFYFLVVLLFTGCSLLSDQTDSDTSNATPFTVYFTNDSASAFPITSIELLPMGSYKTPNNSGVWKKNILVNDTLFPGEKVEFVLDIPSGQFSRYRLSVLDSLSREIKIHEQPNYIDSTALKGTITHWGSDIRTVEVTVSYDKVDNLIWVSGWNDMAGIQ